MGVEVSIANGIGESRSRPYSDQRCIGWYPSYAQNSALSEAAIFGTPGTDLITTAAVNTEIGRGFHVINKIPYAVNGTTLYRINRTFDVNQNETFSTTVIGTIPGAGFVSMADNGVQLQIIIPGVSGFIYNVETDTFSQITDAGFTANGKAEDTVFVDGYFVHKSGKKIFHSEVNNGLSYNSLDVGSAQADPDEIVALVVYKNQLMALGSETIEVFSNVSKFPFTFQRISGYFIPIGCFSAFSPVNFNRQLAFIGGSDKEKAQVFLGSGQNFERISTTSIEQKIQKATDTQVSEAFTWTYSEDGAVFLGIVVADNCYVYDANASALAQKHIWHERRSTRAELNNTQFRWRPNHIVSAYGRILVNDAFNSNFGSISLDTFSEYGVFIKRTLSTQPLTNQGENLFINEVELTMESGVTTDTDNVIELSWSDDNQVYEDPMPADIGESGNYTLRQYWRRLGYSPRFRTFELTYSGKDKSVLLKMEIKLDTSS